MKRLSILLCLFFYSGILNLFSQRIDNIWPIGYDCCQFPNYGAINLNFNSGNLNINQVLRHQNFSETVGSASDSLSQILFSTNGVYVSNSLDDTMQNGNGLNPSYYTNQHLSTGLTLPQGNLVIPSLSDSNQFILFHNTVDDYLNTAASYKLYYSIIDLNQNGGLGAVISKNTVLFTDTMTPGRIVACRHANGRDWWITVRKFRSLKLIEFLYTPYGIQGPFYQDLQVKRDFNIGQSAFNPQGTKYAYFESNKGLEIANFDRCTGQLYNQTYSEIQDSSVYGAGACFSPNGRFLYIATVDHLYQYDTWSSNLDSSKILIAINDGYQDPITLNITHFWILALGPDNKIYSSTSSTTPYLHVINSPDSLGLACDFCQHCINLTVLNAFTMPNFPNYTLGAEAGSICDSLTSSSNDLKDLSDNIILFPNPTSSMVILKSTSSKIYSIIIYNTLGQLVDRKTEKYKADELQINVEKLEAGIYFMEVNTEKGKVQKKFVKEK